MKTFVTTMRKTDLRYGRFVAFYLAAAVVTALATVFTNRISGELSESAVIGDLDALVHLLVMITALMVARTVATALSTLYMARFSASAGYNLRRHFMSHFLRAPFAGVEQAGSGESLSIYSNDAPAAERFITSGVLDFCVDFITFVSAFVFLLFISPFYTGISFAAAVVILVIVVLISTPIQKRAGKMSEKEAGFNAVVNDSLQNLSTVAAYSLEDVLEKRYIKVYEEYFRSVKRFAVALVFSLLGMMFAMFGPLIVIFTVLGLAVINGHLYLADFVAFSLTIMVAVGGLMGVGQGVGQLMEAAGRAKRFNGSTAAEHEDANGGVTSDIPSEVAVSFENVTFAYNKPDAEEGEQIFALEDVSFDIKAGTRVAIVGGSGSGKSTMLKLLLGLYEPDSGEVRINGENAAAFSKADLRSIFAYVPQDSFLFPDSIGFNITIEKDIRDVHRVEKACADAGILDFINSLPEKFNGVLTESAENISGGQRQRIALARAFYKNAPAILFDEATSSLDPTTESAILSSVEKAGAGKTIIMVAHRAKAIAACETIIVMENGKVSAIGNHTELLAVNETYRSLYAQAPH